MTRVNSRDLSVNIQSTFSAVKENCNKVSSLINDFNGDSLSKLQGNAYDVVRAILPIYVKLLDKLGIIAENMPSNIENANNTMCNYMEGNSYLDTAELGPLNSKIKSLEEYISYLENQDDMDYSSLISDCKSDLYVLKHYRDLLNGLSGKDTSIYSSLSDIISDVTSTASLINSLNPDLKTGKVFCPVEPVKLENDVETSVNLSASSLVLTSGFNTSNFSNNALAMFNKVVGSWPSNIDPMRLQILSTAFALYDKGIKYSGSRRTLDGYFDCSSYVTYCYEEGTNINIKDNGTTRCYYSDKRFVKVNENDLIPGDLAVLNEKYYPGGENHIGMYIGNDEKGNKMFIECTERLKGGGIIFSSKSDGRIWKGYLRFNGFSDRKSSPAVFL